MSQRSRNGGPSGVERFESFELSIEQAANGRYRARLTASPMGGRRYESVDFSKLDFAVAAEPEGGRSGQDRDVRRRSDGESGLRLQGEVLFRAVIVGAIAEAYRASRERARAKEHELLVKISCAEAPEVAALPWEALWDPEEKSFVSVARGLPVSTERPRRLPRPTLRIVALLPEPRGKLELSGAAEWAQIRGHLGDLIDAGQVKVERVEPPSLLELDRRLGLVPSCDVLHIVSHGTAGAGGSAGRLQLEDASGRPDWVRGIDLARALDGHEPPRLVVLSACHGASSAEDDAFDGLAQHLLARGVPAVIAMRTTISDAAAVAFASALYRHLAAGHLVEKAVIESRRQLALGQFRGEWATPVLYLRETNVQILQPTSQFRRLGRRFVLGRAGVTGALVMVALLALFAWQASRDGQSTVPPSTGRPGELLTCPSPEGVLHLHFVLIEAGELSLGERTLRVEQAFCLAIHEVTVRDWNIVMEENKGVGHAVGTLPVTQVSTEDARAFGDRLEERNSALTFRLPTDVEWEYAARAESTGLYFFGDDVQDLPRYGNCDKSEPFDPADGLAPIGQYEPNAWGLYDVHGNVAEWVEWAEDPSNPARVGLRPGEDGFLHKFDERGHEMVLKMGGSHEIDPPNCTFEASRSEVKLGRKADVGFRLVMEPVPAN